MKANLGEILMDGVHRVVNSLSDWTGYRYAEERLVHPQRPDCTTLRIPGYKQLQPHTCGFVVAASVLHYFHPDAPLQDLYDDLNLSDGTDHLQVSRALRKQGVGVRLRSDCGFLTFQRAIARGEPVITAVYLNAVGHWVTVYGVDTERRTLFISGNGNIPHLNRRGMEMEWETFKEHWYDAGQALICFLKDQPARTKSRKKKAAVRK